MTVWIALAVAGIVSYLLRVVPVAALARLETPQWMDRAGTYVAPAAFAALAASAVVASLPATGIAPALTVKLCAIAVTALVAYRFRSAGAAVAAGAVVFAGLRLLSL